MDYQLKSDETNYLLVTDNFSHLYFLQHKAHITKETQYSSLIVASLRMHRFNNNVYELSRMRRRQRFLTLDKIRRFSLFLRGGPCLREVILTVDCFSR